MFFVIARSESDEAIQGTSGSYASLDCFASLAMTPVCTCKGFVRR